MESEDPGDSPPDCLGTSPSPASASSWLEEEQVMSEGHLGCPPDQPGPHISHIFISLPPSLKGEEQRIEVKNSDAVEKTTRGGGDHFIVTIRHNITSSIPKVGLQA